MNVCFETFGCRLNRAEALQMESDYENAGWKVTSRHSDADLIVVRGCSVTRRAQQDCEKMIEHLKKHYPTTKLLVCGCLKTKEPPPPASYRLTDDNFTVLPTRTARAYLKVQDGCSGACTFCIVPQFRGSSVSTPFSDVLDRARRFIESGYHEIVVTGCNLAQYLSDGKRLPELLDALAALSPECRIRLGSLEPGPCAMDCIPVFAAHENICRFLHIPVQSGSNVVLKAMRRPYTVKDVETLVASATESMPRIGLGCDLMAGFPGETEHEFRATLGLIKRLKFSNCHVFPYSKRPNTPAAALLNHISRTERHARAHQLAKEANKTRLAFARQFLGKTVEMVVENDARSSLIHSLKGWTGEYLSCRTTGLAPRKSLVKVRVVKVHHDASLEGYAAYSARG